MRYVGEHHRDHRVNFSLTYIRRESRSSPRALIVNDEPNRLAFIAGLFFFSPRSLATQLRQIRPTYYQRER